MLPLLTAALLLVFAIMALQHLRYLRIRRQSAQDRQNPFHSIDVFHLIVMYQVRNGQRVIDAAREYVHKTCGTGARLIYAGQAAFVTSSEQLGKQNWSGFLLLQFSNRFLYERHASFLSQTAQDVYSEFYVHGMRRRRKRSLLMPQQLLRMRLAQLIKRQWRMPALVEQPDYATSPQYDHWRHKADRLRAAYQVNPHGLVVLNLVKHGSPAQRSASDHFDQSMLQRMAALGHGPLHEGRSVALQGNARFDKVEVVQYPNAAYFADLITSSFYQLQLQNRQVADSVWIPTIPFTDAV